MAEIRCEDPHVSESLFVGPTSSTSGVDRTLAIARSLSSLWLDMRNVPSYARALVVSLSPVGNNGTKTHASGYKPAATVHMFEHVHESAKRQLAHIGSHFLINEVSIVTIAGTLCRKEFGGAYVDCTWLWWWPQDSQGR